MAFAMAALLALVALSGVQAAPNLVYPLMDQQPPVARVDTPFIFTLLPSTFNDTQGALSYTTSDMPSWLSFNSGSAAFYGTPTSTDQGEQNVTLTATDSDGTTNTWFNLIVTNFTQPAVHQGFATQISNDSVAQLASVERLPGGTGITIPPYWSFSLGFLWETFRLSRTDPVNGNLFFMARERGTTTLPSWLSFNNQTMTFGGVAPASGTFTIVATGTDFWGYTGAQTSFIIQIGTGEGIEMSRTANFSDIVTVSRAEVDYEVDISDIMVGGEPATADQVVLSLDSPEFSWLSIDSSNRITGTTPDSFQNGTVTPLAVPLTVASTNSSNTLELIAYIGLDVVPYPFTTFEFPNVTADPGQSFEFDLSPYIREPSTLPNFTVLAPASVDVNTSVFPTEAAEWLTFHEGNMTLEGTPPQNPNYDHVEVEFTVGQGASAATSTLRVEMEGISNTPPTGGTTSVPSTTASESSGSGGGGLSTGARIAIGVVFGVLGLIALILLLWFCCRRRKRNKEAEQKQVDDDGDSFVVGSPSQDPFRKSNNVDPPRNLLGEIAKFSGFHIRSPDDGGAGARSPEMQEKPHRLDGLRGIFGWGEQVNQKKEVEEVPGNSSMGSFLGRGDVISVRDPANDPTQSASSFDQTFGSSSSSRASWESRQSFQWSSLENDDSNENSNHRISTAASIPRPRQDFTPRYPRNNSPSRLAHLASQHTLNSPEFSEFHGSSGEDSLANTMQSSSLGSSSGNNHTRQFESNGGFRSIDEEDEGEGTDAEGPAVVSMAERQSFETRTPRQTDSNKQLRNSGPNFPAPGAVGGYRQSVADSAFDDADTTEVHGLGYPASSIFGSPVTDGTRGVSMMSSNPRTSYDPRGSTIKAIPPHENPLSPPLPQVGSFAREITHQPRSARPTPSYRPSSMTTDGRVVACANETFSMHPTINPPPRIALSAATWSSNPPSSYRAEVEGGGHLPTWLHFDARELELWGVPALANASDVTTIKIIEILPRDKRRSDPSQFGYEPVQEREVGRVTVEVVDRLKSPQFALENSPHAF